MELGAFEKWIEPTIGNSLYLMETEGSLPRSKQLTFRYPEPNQSTSSYPISLGYSLILPSHLRLDLQSCLLTSSYEQHLRFFVHVTFLAHVILVDFVTLKIFDVVFET
jgi:hypothetical protein